MFSSSRIGSTVVVLVALALCPTVLFAGLNLVDPFGPEVWKVDGTKTGGQLGFSVTTAGDVNGDFYGDVIVGAPFED